MEKLVTIQQQFPLEERVYTDRKQQEQKIAIRGFVLSDGIDTFYAEALGDLARQMPNYDQSVMHNVQLQLGLRRFTKDGKTRHNTEVKIVKMV